MKRRALLAFLGTSVIAGCSAVSRVFGGDKHTRLSDLMVQNRADKLQQLVAQVLTDDAVVTEETLSLAKDDRSGSKAMVPCGWRDAPGPLSIRVRHAESSDWKTLRLDELTDSSRSVEIIVAIGGKETPSEINFYFSMNSDDSRCSEMTSTATNTTSNGTALSVVES